MVARSGPADSRSWVCAFDTLSRLTWALHEVGVPCAVLKGAPLSAVLYGEPGARASADLDLWIPLQSRSRAREILLSEGWQHADGGAPYDEAYRKPGSHGEEYLEVHSTLLHSRLSYLPFPSPEVAPVEVGGVVLPVMAGALLPVYLAVHIARHWSAPVLWLIDYRTLWESLDRPGQALARWTARRCRAERYLEWVLRRADGFAAAAQGDRVAITRLGLQTHRRDRHPMWRQLQLAPLPDGLFHALRAWLLPPWVTLTAFRPAHAVRRVWRHWGSAVGTVSPTLRTASIPTVAAREVTLAGAHLLRVARDVASWAAGCGSPRRDRACFRRSRTGTRCSWSLRRG